MNYIIDQLEGEHVTIPGSKGTFRILASSKQTNGGMAVFQSGAVLSDAPGFHWHAEAHDVFLVTKGFLKLWNGDKCRIMGPGDFAYIPPVSYITFCVGPFSRIRGPNCELESHPQPRALGPSYRNLWPDCSRRLDRLLQIRGRVVSGRHRTGERQP